VYLRVSYKNNGRAGPYRLYASVLPPASTAAPEVEPNDTLAQATEADSGYFSGQLNGPLGSPDFFRFNANEGELILVGLDADPLRDSTPIDARLDLLDISGTILLSVNEFPSPQNHCYPPSLSNTNTDPENLAAVRPYSPSEGMVFRAPQDGTYFIRVSTINTCTNDNRGFGDYLLAITRNCSLCCVAARFSDIWQTPTGKIVLVLQGTPYSSYTILASDDLLGWTPVGPPVVAGSDGSVMYMDATNAMPHRFYRALLTK
jgi:hypothetical protein